MRATLESWATPSSASDGTYALERALAGPFDVNLRPADAALSGREM